MRKSFLGGVLLVALVAPVAAAEFYLIREVSVPRCEIVEKRPGANEPVIIIGGFATKVEAESALQNSALCRTP